MIVHLVDGTYELFRHFYGARRATNGVDTRFVGVRGVLRGVLEMIENGATHIGVGTDHIIESFRNELWAIRPEMELIASFGRNFIRSRISGSGVWPS